MMRSQGLGARRGFTLIELTLVIAVMGLTFGLVFLKADFLVPSSALKASARQLASNLERARNHAIVSGRKVIFAYDIEGRSYRAYYPFELSDDGKSIIGDGETEILPWTELNDQILLRDVRIGEGESITAGVVPVVFEPRGVCSGHTVHLQLQESERVYTVQVNPILAYVDIEEGDVAPQVLDDSAF